MAIGKVNAYATVEAPKADFGAVAQMNIDNLVKSVKEDEQAKAVKAAAAEKALDEKMGKLALFPDQVKSGTQSIDFESAKNYSDLQEQALVFKRTYEASGGKDNEAKTGYERIIASMNNTNAELKVYGDDLVAVNARIGKDEVYGKYKNKINEISTAAAEGRILVKTDPKTQVKYIAEYIEDPDNPGNMKLGEYRPASEHIKMYRGAPANIKYQDIIKDAKDTFGVSLVETSASYVKKTGEEKLGVLQETGLYDYFLKMVEDDSKAAAIGDIAGVIGKDDYRVSGFKKDEKEKMARVMADRVISSYGTKDTIDMKDPYHAATGGGGSGDKEDKTLTISTTSSIIKADENNISTKGRPLGSKSTILASDTFRKGATEVSIPIGTRTYQVAPVGGKEIMSNSLGMRLTGISVFPDGTFAIRGEKISKSSSKATYGPDTEGESVGESKKEIIISSRTKGSDYNTGIAMMIQRGGSATAANGKTYNFNSRANIEAYAKANYEAETGKPFPKRTTSTGGPAKGTNAGAKKGVGSKYN